MKQANIGVFVVGVFVVLALASTSLVARPQAKDLKGPAIGKTQKSPRLRQVGNYPTMLNMTFPEFAAATDATEYCRTTRLCDSHADIDRGRCRPRGDLEFYRDILSPEPTAGVFRFHQPDLGNGLPRRGAIVSRSEQPL